MNSARICGQIGGGGGVSADTGAGKGIEEAVVRLVGIIDHNADSAHPSA